VLVLLPILALLLLKILCVEHSKSLRWGFVLGAMTWMFLVVVATEALSAFTMLDRTSLALFWLVVSACALARIFYKRAAIETLWTSKRSTLLCKWELRDKVMAAIALGIVLVVGMTAWVSPPNNGDVLAYHLPRIVYWIQHRSVAHYPASYAAQLYQNPGAEFAMLHLMLLAGSDRFVNLVNWWGYVEGLVAIHLIATQLGANRSGAWSAVLFALTLPMAVLEASTAKNDLLLSFFFLAFLALALREFKKDEVSIIGALKIGAVAGLSVLIKGTAYLLIAPFALALLLPLSLRKIRHTIFVCALMIASALALNAGHYARNLKVFGTPLGSLESQNGRTQEFIVKVPSSASFAANAVRMAFQNLGGPFGDCNDRFTIRLYELCAKLGFHLNDPAYTGVGGRFLVPSGWSSWGFGGRDNGYHLSQSFHFGILLLCLLAWMIGARKFKSHAVPAKRNYVLGLVGALFLFCLLLKWEPFQNRLLVPIFWAAAPLFGLMAGGLEIKRRQMLWGLLLVVALPPLLWGLDRPLLGTSSVLTRTREQILFDSQHLDNFARIRTELEQRGCHDLELSYSSVPSHEYLWLSYLGLERPSPRFRVEQVQVQNPSSRIALGSLLKNFHPCARVEFSGDAATLHILKP
jgi:hypothetical protein